MATDKYDKKASTVMKKKARRTKSNLVSDRPLIDVFNNSNQSNDNNDDDIDMIIGDPIINNVQQ